jgi:hypothetical protein
MKVELNACEPAYFSSTSISASPITAQSLEAPSSRGAWRKFVAEASYVTSKKPISSFGEFQELELNREDAERALAYLERDDAVLSEMDPGEVPEEYAHLFKAMMRFQTIYCQSQLHLFLGQIEEAAIEDLACHGALADYLTLCWEDEELPSGKPILQFGERDALVAEALAVMAFGSESEGLALLSRIEGPLSPSTLLILKIKGIPLPALDIELSPFADEMDEEVKSLICEGRYAEAIAKVDLFLIENPSLDSSDRDSLRWARGLARAFSDDYAGAVADFELEEGLINDEPLVRALVHYLNGDLEKARLDLQLRSKFDEDGDELSLVDYLGEGTTYDVRAAVVRKILQL